MLTAQKNKINPFETKDSPLSLMFNMLFKKYYHAAEQQLVGAELDRYFYVLGLICKHEKITQQCLANCLQIDKATMVRVIDYLTDKGLVKRTPHSEDRRAYIISPTTKGLKIAPKIEATFSQLNKLAFNGFSAEEKKMFIEFMNRMDNNLSDVTSNISVQKN
jgi:DNA-binding MarR family transcriptional regulator